MSDDNMLDDDDAMEEWMSLTDAQQDAALEREMNKWNRHYDAMSFERKIAYHRSSSLRAIMENRARLRKPELCTIEYVVGLWREGIRRNQRRLVKIRIWRATGIYPGEA
jgi:hypothetical protein